MSEITVKLTDRGVITIPKELRDAYRLRGGDSLTLIDLDGVFVLSPRSSQVDALADKVAEQWTTDGLTLETMLQALREERDRRDA
jgi:AbrB family looped-hinge helix DNA binding protein